MTFENWSFTIGAFLGLIGLAVAYVQWKQTKDAERLRREQLLASINRAKFMIIPKAVIEKILEKGNPESGETLRQWLWSLHKGASDNYLTAVYSYLSFEDRFTYEDLEYAKQATVITTNWEEQVWRSLIGLRAENRKKGVQPSDFILERSQEAATLPNSEKLQP